MTAGYDIVLLCGQSNTAGRGPIDTDRYDLPNPAVDQYAAAGPYAGGISAAVDPLGHPEYDVMGASGLGPGTAFARWYAAGLPAGRRVLLVPAAWGGTPLSSTAALGWRRGVAGNLYDRAVTQARAALTAAGAGARFAAVLWVQGEADGNARIAGATYQADLDALISGLRADLATPALPFLIGGMVPEYLSTGTRAAIDTVHRATPGRVTGTGYAPGPHGQTMGDGNHYNDTGARLLGRGLFTALGALSGGPAPVADDGNSTIVVANFDGPYSSTSLGRTSIGRRSWRALSGSWGISNGEARDTAPAGRVNHAAVVDDGQADGTITATVGSVGPVPSAGGLIFRATGDRDYLLLTTAGTVFQQVGGAFTELGGSGWTADDGDVLGVVLDGTSITAQINGRTVWAGSSSVNQGATQHGLRSYGQIGMTYTRFAHVL